MDKKSFLEQAKAAADKAKKLTSEAVNLSTKKAEELDGVFSVATSADCVDFPVDTPVILGIQDIRWMARNVLAKEKVLFHGHPIAAVAARTEEIAEKACELIEVEYEELQWANEIDDAIKPGQHLYYSASFRAESFQQPRHPHCPVKRSNWAYAS